MKYLTILGSTGSIGVNTLNVVQGNSQRYRVGALAAGSNLPLLLEQIVKFQPRQVVVKEESLAEKLAAALPWSSRPEILWGEKGYCDVAAADGIDMVVSAMAGSAGLVPTLAAINVGKDIALANKEIMVMAGELITKKARETGSRILPVDSEHSAIFQCLLGQRRRDVKRIILTASGGPFLHLPREQLGSVTPTQALSHPNWQMGKKISVDSATMINKGLEVIEARWLFDLDYNRIHIHVHPQSIVHSLVEYLDGAMLAQLGTPDMRTPIAYALSFPERTAAMGQYLDLLSVRTLEFLPPDFEKFPGLKLAYEAGRRGATTPTVFNAANEVAVEAFLGSKISFTEICKVIEDTISLTACNNGDNVTVDDILAADAWARLTAGEIICKIGL